MTGSVQFGFISLKLKKPKWTKPEKTRKKPSQTEKTESNWKTEPNRFEPVFFQKTEPKPVGWNWFWFFF